MSQRVRLAGGLLLSLAALFPALAGATTYQVDPVHSAIEFSVRHFLSPVPGRFEDFDGKIEYDRASLPTSTVGFTVQAGSIDTHNDQRDKHLKSPDFFDVAKYPTLTFQSTGVKPMGANKLSVTGNLTIHGVTKQISIPVEVLGTMKMPDGSEKAGFSTNFTIDRKDFGISWNRVMDQGGAILGDDVKISITVEANHKSEEKPAK